MFLVLLSITFFHTKKIDKNERHSIQKHIDKSKTQIRTPYLYMLLNISSEGEGADSIPPFF